LIVAADRLDVGLIDRDPVGEDRSIDGASPRQGLALVEAEQELSSAPEPACDRGRRRILHQDGDVVQLLPEGRGEGGDRLLHEVLEPRSIHAAHSIRPDRLLARLSTRGLDSGPLSTRSAAMRSRIGAWAIVGLAGALLAPACGRAPAVRYEVAFSEAHPDHLAVTLRLDGVPRGGLTLKGFATKEVLRVTGLEAEGPGGRVIPVEAGLDTVSVNGRSLDIPRFGIAGPLPRALTVRYLASP